MRILSIFLTLLCSFLLLSSNAFALTSTKSLALGCSAKTNNGCSCSADKGNGGECRTGRGGGYVKCSESDDVIVCYDGSNGSCSCVDENDLPDELPEEATGGLFSHE